MKPEELKWYEMYEYAKEYYIIYNNLDIKKSYKLVHQGKTLYLGNWISRQRYDKKRGRLTYTQIELLDKISMIWDKSNHFADEWNKMFSYAKKFYDTFGHLNIPKEYRVNKNGEELQYGTLEYESDDSLKLGIWIINQRQAYKGIGNGKMTENKKQLLNSIGMIWSINDLEWYKMYEYAKKYYEKYNHLNVHLHYRIDSNGNELLKGTPAYESKSSIKLGQWIGVQRLNKKNGILKSEYATLLELIGMVWNSRKNKEKVRQLCRTYSIDYNLNESILNKPYDEIVAKILFLLDINEPIIIDNKVHSIFFMSSIDMQKIYNISIIDLIDKYVINNKQKTL